MRWKGIERRLKDVRVLGLRYERESGYVVVELEAEREVWISADTEGCHVITEPGRPDRHGRIDCC